MKPPCTFCLPAIFPGGCWVPIRLSSHLTKKMLHIFTGRQSAPNGLLDVQIQNNLSFKVQCTRDLKSQNFPGGRLKRAKTFWTKCVNHFRNKCIKKVRKSFLRHKHHCFCSKHFQIGLIYQQVYLISCYHEHTIRKFFRPSGNFPDHPETFKTIRRVSRPS